ncbi:MAG TPA: hypothetical protein VHD62_02635 [Opitutaceae bacterium]|nr:hypothetical protein [Opitutaceae bacterium]
MALWLAGAVSLASGVALMLWFWPGGLPYDATSGVWTALASDVAHGEFYRAVHGPAGYGGTRYMPLFFLLHGGLIHAGMDAVAAGLALTIGSLMLLMAGTFALMRRLGASVTVALPATGVLLASITLQLLAIAVKGDLLAAALNVGGLALAVGAGGSSRGWRVAGALLAAAMLTKFTAIFALVALAIWLARRGEWSRLRKLIVGTLAVVGAGLALTWWLSAGRIAENFAICATGGLSIGYAAKFPWWFVCVLAQDPFLVAIFLAAAVAAFLRGRRTGFDLLQIYFVVTTVGTILLFASPGTDSNHLVDLLVASVVLLAVGISAGQVGRTTVRGGAGLLAVAVAAMWLPGVPSVRHFLEARGRPTQAGIDEIQRRLPPGAADRLLAENPMVPVALGRRPEVLDAFSLRLIAARDPRTADEFLRRILNGRYSAVVLVDWSGVPSDDRWREIERHASFGAAHFYGEMNFPPGFLEALRDHYRLSFVFGVLVVFEPKKNSP